LAVDLGRGREDQHARARGHFPALHDFGGDGEVIEPAIGAGADDDLVDGGADDLINGLHIVHRVRAGNLRL